MKCNEREGKGREEKFYVFPQVELLSSIYSKHSSGFTRLPFPPIHRSAVAVAAGAALSLSQNTIYLLKSFSDVAVVGGRTQN